MVSEQKYWFPAKTYGFGWGVPSCWQGWAVLGGFGVLVAAGGLLLPPDKLSLFFITYELIVTAILLLIMWKTGEPLEWRWGKK